MALPPQAVDPKLWREVAGPVVQLPTLNARVYYFAQGHIEENNEEEVLPHLIPMILGRPIIPCIITSVEYLADPTTEEIFSKLTLEPLPWGEDHPPSSAPSNFRGFDNPVSHAKIITQGDSCELGEFFVDKELVEFVFPRMPPRTSCQILNVTDLLGFTWSFQHRLENSLHSLVFERHQGVCSFAKAKNLIPGDSLVFMKKPTGKLYVGIQRQRKSKVSSQLLMQSLHLAMNNTRFEVVYYPNTNLGWTDFVVRAEVVRQVSNIGWFNGMRVKLANNPNIMGTIVSLKIHPQRLWDASLWRIIEVKWDGIVLHHFRYVSPWQVNPASASATT